jgi:MULE transposase domain
MMRHKEVVVDMLTRGIPARTVIDTLRQEYPLLAVQPRDIYNLKQRLHLEFLEGRTPIQALIEAIPNEHVWKFRVQTDENNRVTALLALNRQCFKMWFRNPWVLFMDCTYKTNRYKMPLLDIVGCNAMNSTFYVGFAFVNNEQEDAYGFILQHLKTSYEHFSLPQLRTVLTDKDNALMNAVKTAFPLADNLICAWHINKSILAKAKPLIRSEFAHIEDDDEFNKAVESCWKSMLEE